VQQKNQSIPAEGIGWIVNGEEHRTGTRLEVRAPFDQSLVAHVWQATWTDAEQAVAAATAGFARTSALGSWERPNILSAVAARLQSQHEQFAQTIMPASRSQPRVRKSIAPF
jgi:acyl-CoA reductase-like NAD-dependent aldehyde dehydrogenase